MLVRVGQLDYYCPREVDSPLVGWQLVRVGQPALLDYCCPREVDSPLVGWQQVRVGQYALQYLIIIVLYRKVDSPLVRWQLVRVGQHALLHHWDAPVQSVWYPTGGGRHLRIHRLINFPCHVMKFYQSIMKKFMFIYENISYDTFIV